MFITSVTTCMPYLSGRQYLIECHVHNKCNNMYALLIWSKIQLNTTIQTTLLSYHNIREKLIEIKILACNEQKYLVDYLDLKHPLLISTNTAKPTQVHFQAKRLHIVIEIMKT